MARILAIGGAHIDRTGRLDAPHHAGASNPGRWVSEPGGGAFNAARNLARLGHHVTLVSPRGGDAAADQVAEAAEAAGIVDCPLTFLDRATPSYTAILEPDGNLVTALADMALYDIIPARRLMSARMRARIAASDLVLADANLPQDALTALTHETGTQGVPMAAIAVSPAKVVRWKASLSALTLLAMNTAEAAALARGSEGGGDDVPGAWLPALRATGLGSGLVSAGAGPVHAYAGETALSFVPPPLSEIVDVTGAGDALLSGYLDAWLNGKPVEACLISGIALARLTTATAGPVRQDLTGERLAQAIAAMPKPAGI
ncbi:MAG: carbohydrate kinase family protein [Hoeflea sp.]|uniref:carbohydrate kinase family protein n=1 Tax=Hoeflea sp. TaxID=1940281 RepID=UPI0032F00453